MKKGILSLRGLAAALVALFALSALSASATTWDFSSVSATDKANLDADKTNWKYDATNNRWGNLGVLTNTALKANGAELEFTKGLIISTEKADQVRVDAKKNCFTLNNSAAKVTIPSLKAGWKVTIICTSSNSKEETAAYRTLEATNLTQVSGFETANGKTKMTRVGTVTADGDMTFNATGGMYIHSITVDDGQGGGNVPGGNTPSSDHSVKMNPQANQMLLRTTSGDLKYYNTNDLSEVNIDKATGTVTVTPKVGDWNDEFKQNIAAINFAKAPESGSEGDITNGGVNITEAKGWLESCYVKWEPLQGATTYRVYIKGGKYANFTKIDPELVRNYGSYGRADMVGLSAGTYSLKVVPVIGGAESENNASVANDMVVKAHDRSGFAFLNGFEPGAYKNNGELKADARVIYVTASTAKTVKCLVKQSNKDGDGTEFTGLQAILGAYQKGVETRPLCVRIVGTVTKENLDAIGSSAEGLQIKGKGAYSPLNITIEGIGDDATTSGFGFLIRNSKSVEFRNFANMLCMDDCLSFDTDNSNCWIHHMDFFYGNTGGDSDQAKGDGTVDIKGDSQYMTVAYNHFFDCGKTSLCGMTSETGPNYIDYHHNWFDHSDSRHPRIRTMSVHVWNNYYDGTAKYGVGATSGSSAFVENNYFRGSKKPMLISQQGTDISGDGKGTFSGEEGGIIKSFGNVYADKGANGNFTPTTFALNQVQFDCYEAKSRDEQIPSSVKTVKGSHSYNNFDTDSKLMYEYTPVDATDVPSVVTGFYGAGRLNHGDFSWDLNYTGADEDYGVISALKSALNAYKSSLVGIFE